MKILASSVIRSTHRGESHGGIFLINTETKEKELVVDWDDPTIDFSSGGGDRGIRGMSFYGDYLYAAGANSILVFDRNFKLTEKYNHYLMDGTHEIFIQDNLIYNISNCFDAILIFDLEKKEWTEGFQHIKGRRPEFFNPQCDIISRADTLHLDSVSVKDDWIWYAGSTTEFLYGINRITREFVEIPLCYKNTHNAQFWKDGIVFNRSLESDTVYQIPANNGKIYEVDWKIEQRWRTPIFPKDQLKNAHLPADHARSEYTRGMVLGKTSSGEDSVIIGTSPATVHEFVLGEDEPINTINLTNDLRNSMCGICEYKW